MSSLNNGVRVLRWLESIQLISKDECECDSDLFPFIQNGILLCNIVNYYYDSTIIVTYSNLDSYGAIQNLRNFFNFTKEKFNNNCEGVNALDLFNGDDDSFDRLLRLLTFFGQSVNDIPRPSTVSSLIFRHASDTSVNSSRGSMALGDFDFSKESLYDNFSGTVLSGDIEDKLSSPGSSSSTLPTSSSLSNIQSASLGASLITGSVRNRVSSVRGDFSKSRHPSKASIEIPPILSPKKNNTGENDQIMASDSDTSNAGSTPTIEEKEKLTTSSSLPLEMNNLASNGEKVLESNSVDLIKENSGGLSMKSLDTVSESSSFEKSDEVDSKGDGVDLSFADSGVKAIAKWAYAAQKTDELTFKRADIINLTKQPDEGWWEGRIDENFGWFPDCYVEAFEGDVPPELSSEEEDSEDEEEDEEDDLMIDYVAPDPETIRSGQPLRLEAAAEVDPIFHRQAVEEMIHSEYSFLNSLDVYSEQFLKAMSCVVGIEPEVISILTCNIPEISKFHNDMYNNMLTLFQEEEPKWGAFFQDRVEDFEEIYQEFFSLQPDAIACFHENRVTTLFSTFVDAQAKKLQKPNSVIVPAYLNDVTERLKRYNYFLKDMARHTLDDDEDKPILVEVIMDFDRIVNECAYIRKMKDYEKTFHQADVDGLSLQQKKELGFMEHYFQVIRLDPAKDKMDDMAVAVFSEVCMVFKKTVRNGKLYYSLKEKFALNTLSVIPYDDNDNVSGQGIKLQNAKHVFSFTLTDGTDRKSCLDSFHRSIERAYYQSISNPDETDKKAVNKMKIFLSKGKYKVRKDREQGSSRSETTLINSAPTTKESSGLSKKNAGTLRKTNSSGGMYAKLEKEKSKTSSTGNGLVTSLDTANESGAANSFEYQMLKLKDMVEDLTKEVVALKSIVKDEQEMRREAEIRLEVLETMFQAMPMQQS